LIKCFLILIAVLNVTPTMAAGAVALASPDDIAHGGVAIGIQVNLLVEDDAKRYAMSECELEKTQNSVRVPCMIVATFHNQCAAFAIDFGTGTPGFGWAIAQKKDDATDLALKYCRNTAGERKDFCNVVGVKCDGTAAQSSPATPAPSALQQIVTPPYKDMLLDEAPQ
jgi:hypothetical protein